MTRTPQPLPAVRTPVDSLSDIGLRGVFLTVS